MKTRDFSTYFLYRWRYVIGYVLISILLAAVLLFAGLYLPGGISTLEMDAAVRSSALQWNDPSTLAIVNLPYHALQAGIFSLFGISIFTIKLPSLLLGLLSAIGLIMLLRRWFKPNIAVLTSLIAIATGQFVFISQLGTASILYIFWPIILLLLGTQITRCRSFKLLWKILFVIAAGLSLYTPLSIYPLLAILLAVVLHPHLRAVVRRMKKLPLTLTVLTFALIVTPLAYLIVAVEPSLILSLLGIPTQWPPDLLANISTLAQQYFMFWQPSVTTVLTPVFGLGSALLILLGAYRLLRTRETTRSYLIILWIMCLLPVLLLNPVYTSVTFLPSILLLAAGLTSLISYWYRLFPLNPYARIAGLVPIIILVGALITTGIARYGFGYHYSPDLSSRYSTDLRLLPTDATQVITAGPEADFYLAVAATNDTIEVVTVPTADVIAVTRLAQEDFAVRGYELTEIITSPRSEAADRWYVYQKQ